METQIFENIANEIVLFLIITAISIPFAVIKYFINRKLETFQNIYNKNQEKKTRKILPFLIASIVLIGVGCLLYFGFKQDFSSDWIVFLFIMGFIAIYVFSDCLVDFCKYLKLRKRSKIEQDVNKEQK